MILNNYHLVVSLIGLVFLFELLTLTPFFYRYFGREYFPQSFIKNKLIAVISYILMLASILALIANFYVLISSFVLLIIFRYFHIDARFKSFSRGAGAVGYMPYHSMLYVFLYEMLGNASDYFFYQQILTQIYIYDFAIIMLCAGISKGLAGYSKSYGFEIAMANPFWCNYFNLFKNLKPQKWLISVINYLGFVGEIVVGVLLLFESTLIWGAILWILIFIYILFTINLAGLPLLMIVIPIFFVPDVNILLFSNQYRLSFILPEFVADGIVILMIAYLILTLGMKIYLYTKTFFKKNVYNKHLEKIALHIPIFIWRVFTADVTNIFVRISFLDDSHTKKYIIHEDDYKWKNKIRQMFKKYRFYHVAEMVVLSTIFNTLKYANVVEFEKKIERYSKTLNNNINSSNIICYELIYISRTDDTFEYLKLLEYQFNLENNSGKMTIFESDYQEKLKLITRK